MKIIKINEKIEIQNYKYRNTTTKCLKWLEYNPKKGYRQWSQKMDPFTQKWLKPKKTTFFNDGVTRLFVGDDNISYRYLSMRFWDFEKDHDNFFGFLSKYYDSFTPEELRGITNFILSCYRVNMYTVVVYSGLDKAVSLRYHKATIQYLTDILALDSIPNFFKNFKFDYGYKIHFPKNFNPFKLKNYGG
tara:strand:- start:2515 stop:3081 length:567 start_codon:yes stop_codon:yes gene_type:complete